MSFTSLKYALRESKTQDPAFCAGRNLEIVLMPRDGGEESVIGRIGVFKPSVVKAFNLKTPVSFFEFTLEPFLDILPESEFLI